MAVFSKADAKVLRIFHSTKSFWKFFAKNMHFRVIFDIYQSNGKQKRNQEGLFDQIGEKKEEEGH